MAATIEDLMREIDRAKKVNEALEERNRITQERLTRLALQFAEIGELLGQAGEKAREAKKLAL